jgi:hypothetical protein
MARYLIRTAAITAALTFSLAFASTADAGPLRNLVSRLRGKPRAVAARVLKLAAKPVQAVRGGCSAGQRGACANGQCTK